MTEQLAEAAVRKSTTEPWGYLARCDIARKLGNADLMQACISDLQRVAPADVMTKQALAYATERAPLVVWILRILLAVTLVGTLLHKLLLSLRSRRPVGPPALLAASLLVAFSWLGSQARADDSARGQLSKIKLDDADPEASVPSVEVQNQEPLEFGYFIQDLAARAEYATKMSDHTAEARYYRALAKAAPKSAFAPRKLCNALDALGDTPNAVLACRTALTREGTIASDYIHFVSVVLQTKGPLPTGERAELDAVLRHLASEAQLGSVPTMLGCEVALRFSDTPALERCTAELDRTAPNDPKTVSLKWALALQKHDRAAALQLIDRARSMGMKPDGIAKMEETVRTQNIRRIGRFALVGALGIGVLVFGFFGFRRSLQRRRLAV